MSEETETLQELLREAHEVLKDLRAANKEARRLVDAMPSLVKEAVGALLLEAANSELVAYHEAMGRAIEAATTKVYDRFDQLGKMLLGETAKANAILVETSMENHIRAVRKVIEDRGIGS
jgi:hypothetical protein